MTAPAQDYCDQAIPLLRAAGLGELADRIEDDPWGTSLSEVLSEVALLSGGE